VGKIALCIVATNNYCDFVVPLIESAEKYFLADQVGISTKEGQSWLRKHNVHYHIFSNNMNMWMVKLSASDSTPRIHMHVIDHEPWPAMTLNRYDMILGANLKGYDAVYYIDADSRFVAPVGDEVLQNMVVVAHPGYYIKGNGSWETNPKSHAFVSPVLKNHYVCGGFQGGRNFLEYAEIMQRNIEADTASGITAVWHDESHLNAIYGQYRNHITLLPCDYMMPESLEKRKAWRIASINPKILALEKDHKNYQK
jgi:hypothetical protein